MDAFTVTDGAGRFVITARVYLIGRDILVLLSGGFDHIGAIGMAQPRSSLRDAHKISSTGSVFTLLGHKEDDLAKSMSEEIAQGLNRKTIVVAGLHWNEITDQDLQLIVTICEEITETIISRIPKAECDTAPLQPHEGT